MSKTSSESPIPLRGGSHENRLPRIRCGVAFVLTHSCSDMLLERDNCCEQAFSLPNGAIHT